MSEERTNLEERHPRRQRRRGCTLGCAITLAVVLLALIAGWWVVSRHLGALLAGLVREKAGESINGRLDFASLEVDLAGRAVLKDAAVYPKGATDAVLTCPRVVISFDLFNLLGPNRGRRAVDVALYSPRATATRTPDGMIDLVKLYKPPPQKPKNPLGVQIVLRDAQVDFTDGCMLDQTPLKLPKAGGVAGKLLAELGYGEAGRAELPLEHEVFGVQGSVTMNPEREELALDLRVDRAEGGGRISAKGSAKTDGSRYKVRAVISGMELASLSRYIQTAFPRLAVGWSTGEVQRGKGWPYLAGLVGDADVEIAKEPQQAITVQGTAQVKELRLVAAAIPELYLPQARLHYDSAKGGLGGDIQLNVLGVEITGKPEVNLITKTLAGKLTATVADPQSLLDRYAKGGVGVTGAAQAKVELSGTFDAPVVQAELGGAKLAYGKLDLGRLAGTILLAYPRLTLTGVKLTGGATALSASGELDLATQSGKLTVSAGPLPAAQAVELASKLSQGQPPAKLDLSGDLQAALELTLAQGRPDMKLRVWSKRLGIAGVTLTELDAVGRVTPPNIVLDAAEATLVTAEAVQAAGLKSNGPLKLALRVGGSVSQNAKGKMVLALSGTAKSLNLAPDQANASFKVAGPANDPEIRLQLKTTNQTSPLAVNAVGHYRQGYSPLTATMTWYSTEVKFTGKVDLAKKLIDGDVTAQNVDLWRMALNPNLTGTVSASAKVSGNLDQPSVKGTVTSPRLTWTTPQRAYSVTDLKAGLELLKGSQVSVSNGVFDFEGNHFTAGGTLGKSDSDIELKCKDFNLFSVLAMVPASGTKQTSLAGPQLGVARKPVTVKSSGPLAVQVKGTLEAPTAVVAYTSGAGEVDGHPFTSASLNATVTKDGATIQAFTVESPSGAVNATGQIAFQPVAYSAAATISGFDVGVLTPLTNIEQLASLTGKLNGTLRVSGAQGQFGADGSLALTEGTYQGKKITSASADLSTKGKAVAISNATLVAEGTTLTGSGTIGPDPASTQFTIQAPSVDLAFLHFFLPGNTHKLAGVLKLDMSLKPGKGRYPDVELTAQDTGKGLSFDGKAVTALTAELSLKQDLLNLTKCNIALQKSSLNVSGKLNLAELKNGGQANVPLDLAISAQNFNLQDASTLVPAAQRDYLPSGTVTCDLDLGGTSQKPLASGTIEFTLTSLPAAMKLPVNGASGKVSIAKNDFSIDQLTLDTSDNPALANARIQGSGRLSLRPLGLIDGSIDVVLAPEGQYAYLETTDGMFKGTVGGMVRITGRQDGAKIATEIGGRVVLTQPGSKSVIHYKPPTAGGGGGPESPFRFSSAKGLELVINPGTEFRYAPVDLQAELSGSLTLYGRPGRTEGPEAFRIIGELDVPKGSLFVYRHTIRLEPEDNSLLFTGVPGDLFPYFTGTGALILAHALTGNEQLAAAPTQGTTSVSANQDLKVLFHFDRVKLAATSIDLETVTLSSEPPLSPDKIRLLLLGGVGDVLAGNSDFSSFAESEAIGIGTGWISRQVEDALGLEAFSFGGTGSDENPFYMSLEKSITPEASITYFRDFYSSSNQKEEFGLKYKLFEQRSGKNYQNVQLNLNYEISALSGNSSEFMFMWNMKF